MYLQYYRNAEKRVMVIFVRDPFFTEEGGNHGYYTEKQRK